MILPIQPVDCKTNEIKALPPVIAALAQRGVVFAFDALNTQKSGCNRAEVSSACVAPSKLVSKSSPLEVHHVRDVTQGEDASRIRVKSLPNIFALARNFTLNLYREDSYSNMAQAQRRAGSDFDFLKSLFRMK